MNPDKCARCHKMVDPFDPEYCFWNGQRWHVSCALMQANDDIETIREKQGRHDTTAANYSALQAKIDDLMDQREGLMKILREVPDQANGLGMLFITSGERLVRRVAGGHHAGGGHLLEGETDSRDLFRLPDAKRDQNRLTEGNHER